MPEHMTRRKALATGAATTGIMLGSNASKSEAYSLPKTWGEDFLTPWSPPENVKRDLTPGKTPIRLSCNAYGLRYSKDLDIAARLKSIQDAGYTACEGGDEWKNATDSQIRELKDALKTHDVMFYTLHRFMNNIHPDLSERRKFNKITAENVEAAERLGLKFIVSHTGSCDPNPGRTHKDNWTKETWMATVNAFKQIIKDTSGSNVDLAVEAINPTNINNPKAHVRLKEDVGDPRIKVCFDPTNMYNPNVYYRATELLNDCFDLRGEDICYAHAKDILWTNNMLPAFEWVIPGNGSNDYETYLTRLSRLKHPRALMLEFLSGDQYPQAKKFIEDTARKVGVTIYS